MTNYSITELTENLLGEAATEEEKATLHRQVRNFYRRGFLPAEGVRDERGTAEFAVETLYRVRVLSALTTAGFDADSNIFRASVFAMSAMPNGPDWAPSQKIEGAYTSRGGLGDAINGVTNYNERWFLSFTQRTPYLHGFGQSTARFHWSDDDAPIPAFLEGTAFKTTFTGQIDLTEIFVDLPHVDFERA